MDISIYYFATIIVLYSLVLSHIIAFNFIYIALLLAFIPVFFQALQQLQQKRIGSEVFLVIATLIGIIGHQEKAITAILIIMIIAEYLADLIKRRTEIALHSLVALIPQQVIRVVKDKQEIIAIEHVAYGDTILVKTGKRIPIDGRIIQGFASINESSLTGESTLKEKGVGDFVYAGTFIQAGSITVKTEKVAKQTLFAHIISLVQRAQLLRAHIATFADKVAFFLIPSLLIFIFFVFLITRDMSLVVTLLVFGSPLELTLVTPMAVLAGVAAALRNGILVKGGLALEQLAYVDVMVFDKTGTLTLGDPRVINIESFDEHYSKAHILRLAAIAEKMSDHVLAQAVLAAAAQQEIDVPNPDIYQSFVGHGIEMTYQGNKYFVGNKHFIQAPEHANIPLPKSESEGFFSSFYVANHAKVIGKIQLADKIRPDARDIIQQLQRDGIKKIILLSGDNQAIVSDIAKQLGIDHYYGNMFPDQKIEIINALQKKGHIVAMVGDGINDAPALQQANVGIALGAMGMEPAIQAADIVLMANDLEKIVYVNQLARTTLKVIKQNIIVGFGIIHAIGIIFAFLKLINPIQAALFHAVPDIAMLINSARLIRFKKR